MRPIVDQRIARPLLLGHPEVIAARVAELGIDLPDVEIVDIGAEVFAMAASCVRATAERDTHPDGVELAAAFCEQARVRVDALFGALWHNSDRSDRHLARRVFDGHHARLEDGVLHIADDLPWVAAWERGPATVPDVRRRIPRPQ